MLLAQHSAETGQEFEESALARVWELTRGQPWLVNALAEGACSASEAVGGAHHRGQTVDSVAIDEAKETLILETVTHLDQLADKLREDRVRRVIEPVMAGTEEHVYSTHDLEYVRDLGLVARDDPVRIANPLYAEVLPRELTYPMQSGLPQDFDWHVDASGNVDVASLLGAFQRFFREHSDHWVQRFGYEEAGPQLVLQAFLQRVVNGGGRIEREYRLGRGRTDLLILWPEGGDPTRMRKHVIECKVMRQGQGRESTVRPGPASSKRRCTWTAARRSRGT